jgi:hypothetical protein
MPWNSTVALLECKSEYPLSLSLTSGLILPPHSTLSWQKSVRYMAYSSDVGEAFRPVVCKISFVAYSFLIRHGLPLLENLFPKPIGTAC